jgi:uncharacterized membrane protein
MAIVVPEADDVFPVSQPVATDLPGAAGEADAADIQAATSGQSAREARAQARAARRAARTERGGTPAAIIVGGFLVLLGAFFLLRQILPSFDFDWFWPLALVGLGAVLIVTAIGRGPRSGDTP